MDLFDHAAQAAPEFKIERNIPLESDRAGKRNQKWPRPDFPFDLMETGDSFVVRPDQCGGAPLIVVQNIVSGAAATYRRNAPGDRRFATRQCKGEFIRCWRTQ